MESRPLPPPPPPPAKNASRVPAKTAIPSAPVPRASSNRPLAATQVSSPRSGNGNGKPAIPTSRPARAAPPIPTQEHDNTPPLSPASSVSLAIVTSPSNKGHAPVPVPVSPISPVSPVTPSSTTSSSVAMLSTNTSDGTVDKSVNCWTRLKQSLSGDDHKYRRWIVIASLLATSLILIITLSVVLTRSSPYAGLSEADQKRLTEANNMINELRDALRQGTNVSTNFDSGTLTLNNATLTNAGFSQSEISSISASFAAAGFPLFTTPLYLETQPVFCTTDDQCRSIDPDATCSTTKKTCTCVADGVSGFNCQYPPPSFVLNTDDDITSCSGSQGTDASLLEYDYTNQGGTGAWSQVFGGFPTRKNMDVDDFWDPDTQNEAVESDDEAVVDTFDVSYVFYATTKLFGVTVKATIWLYIPSISQLDGTRGIAIRFSVPNMSLRSIPSLASTMGASGTSWLDSFTILNTSAIVVTTEAWNSNGYEVVQGVNLRVALAITSGRSSALMNGWKQVINNDIPSFDLRSYIPVKGGVPSFEIAIDPDAYLVLPDPVSQWVTVNHMEMKVIGSTSSITAVLSAKVIVETPVTATSKYVCVRSTGIATFVATTTGTFNLAFILDGYDWSVPYVSDVMYIDHVATRVNLVKDTTSLQWSFDATLQTRLRATNGAGGVIHTIIGIEPPTFGFVTDTFINTVSPAALICNGMVSCPSVVNSALNSVQLTNVGIHIGVVAGGANMQLNNVIVPNGVRIYIESGFVIPAAIQSMYNTLRLGINNQSSIIMGVQVPFTNPALSSVFVRYDNILDMRSTAPLFQFSFAMLSLQPGIASVSVAGGFMLNLQGNPTPLYFTCAATVTIGTSGGVTIAIQGAMAGTWVNAFTVPGLDISNVVAQIGMTIPPTGIPVPSSVGAQGNFSIGSTYLFFAMSVNPTLRQFYLAANTPKLGFADLIAFVIKTTSAPVSTNLISTVATIFAPLSVTGVDILIAPIAYTQPDTGVVIPQGFKIKGKFNFLLVSVDIDVALTQRTVTWWPSPINTFKLSLAVATPSLATMFSGVNVVTPVMNTIRALLNQWTSISFGGFYTFKCTSTSPVKFPPFCDITYGGLTWSFNWDNVINTITNWLTSNWAVASVSFTNVDLVGMVDKTQPVNPSIAFTVSVPGKTITWSTTVDVNAFVNQQASAVSAFASSVGRNAEAIAMGVLANFCNTIKMCHTFSAESPLGDISSTDLCLDVGGFLGVC